MGKLLLVITIQCASRLQVNKEKKKVLNSKETKITVQTANMSDQISRK